MGAALYRPLCQSSDWLSQARLSHARLFQFGVAHDSSGHRMPPSRECTQCSGWPYRAGYRLRDAGSAGWLPWLAEPREPLVTDAYASSEPEPMAAAFGVDPDV